MKYIYQYLLAHPLQSFFVWMFTVLCLNCFLVTPFGFPGSLLVGLPVTGLLLWKWPFPDQYPEAKHRQRR